jgi:hypothetical protein
MATCESCRPQTCTGVVGVGAWIHGGKCNES